jgi:hypothetical protein
MSYMGWNHAGSMSWTCMTCHREVHLEALPRVTHACLVHGPMCYVLDSIVDPNAMINTQARYWSCCDATQQDDVPLPISHLMHIGEVDDDWVQEIEDSPEDAIEMDAGVVEDAAPLAEDAIEMGAEVVEDAEVVGDVAEEVAQLQMIAQSYDTIEEEIALEALLMEYD